LGHAQGLQPERFVVIREAGKPAQKCRVLKCWKDKQGNKVCQVQVMDTGEMMTILEPDASPGSSPGRGALASRLFHWGADNTAPQGTPQPPPTATVVAAPTPPARPSMWDRMFASSRPHVSTGVVQVAQADTPPQGNSLQKV